MLDTLVAELLFSALIGVEVYLSAGRYASHLNLCRTIWKELDVPQVSVSTSKGRVFTRLALT